MSTVIMTPVIMYPREAVLTAVAEKRQSLGRLLRERRLKRDIPQEDIAEALEFVQSYISKLERGGLDRAMKKWKPERIWTMFKAYKYSDDEARALAEQFELDIPYDKRLDAGTASDPLERFAVGPVEWEIFDVFTSASAGTGEPEIVDGETAAIPKGKLRRRGASRNDVMVLKVNGDCLVSQGIRFSGKNIAHGDYVFVHVGAPAISTDIVCLWDDSEGQLILKFLSEQQDPNRPDQIILLDAKGERYIRDVSDVKYRGVVFYRSGDL